MKRYSRNRKLLFLIRLGLPKARWIFLFFCFLVFFNIYSVGLAPAAATGTIVPAPASGTEGDYTLNDFIQVFINIADWILGIVGSLALLAFIYGGVLFLISAGNSEMVEKAKRVLTGAVIGIVIVFASFMIIGFTISAMGIDAPDSSWAKAGWFADRGSAK